MLKIALCEDEQLQRETIKNYIDEIIRKDDKNYELVEFESGESLLNKYPKGLDILFLDIQMGDINGMDTARKIREFDENVEIIFITGVWEYIQEGYEVRAYRYLIKPVDFENFKTQLSLCIKDIEKQKKSNILVTYKSESNKVDINSILYIETDNRNTIIHTIDKSYKSNMGINKLEKDLEDKSFVRCHNSFLINLQHISKIGQNSVNLGEFEVLVSRHKMKDLKLKLTSFLGDKL
ncbi:MAG: LytTR family DNA-binding domain-containing protein [Romboutsia sp.]